MSDIQAVGAENDRDAINEQFVIACRFLESKSYESGEKALLELLKKVPGDLNVNLKLIECHINQGRYLDAFKVLSGILPEHGETRAVLLVTPIVLFCLNDYEGAYKATLLLTEEERKDRQIQNIVQHSIMFVRFDEYSAYAEQDVLGLIEAKSLSESDFYSIAQQLAGFKLGLKNKELNLKMNELVNDQLLLKLLSFSYIRSAALEDVVTALRNKLLTFSLAEMELPDNLVELAQAVSMQSFNNEYVHCISEAEEEMLGELEEMLARLVESEEWSPFDVEGLFLLLCMYRRLYDLPFKDKLLELEMAAWPDSLKPLVKLTLYDVNDEVSWLEKVESIGTVDGEVSSAVQKQYEEYPYPRWSQLYLPQAKTSYQVYMRNNIYGYDEAEQSVGEYDVLVAGCGTGFHPLNLAGSIHGKITAIDLSKRSLAYALMSAEKQGISGVDFYQLDLLKVKDLKRDFDVVESVGVLHHMDDPEEGLKALLGVVRPGGYLRLGLYSEISRQQLVKLRKLYVKSGMSPTAQNIRAIRQTILNSQAAQEVFGVVNQFTDFYAMSSCRDLIFHEQEHRFTLPQIKKLLKKHKLKFLGFSGLKRTVVEAFVQKYDADSLVNLDTWAEFEKANPNTFSSMYQFMTQVLE